MVFERKGFAREMVSNCNVGATTYTVCKRAREEFKDMNVGNHKICKRAREEFKDMNVGNHKILITIYTKRRQQVAT